MLSFIVYDFCSLLFVWCVCSISVFKLYFVGICLDFAIHSVKSARLTRKSLLLMFRYFSPFCICYLEIQCFKGYICIFEKVLHCSFVNSMMATVV